MEEVARSIHPELYETLKTASSECDKLGRTGANLYRCDGYIAVEHLEDDLTAGLCSQLEWDADRKYVEFGFVQPQWGYVIRTERNTLWSVFANL